MKNCTCKKDKSQELGGKCHRHCGHVNLDEAAINRVLKETVGGPMGCKTRIATDAFTFNAAKDNPINFGIHYTGKTESNAVNAYSPVTNDTVGDFHSKRLLFMIISNKVFAETKPSGMSHFEWIKTLDLSKVIVPYNELDAKKNCNYIIDNFTRGYFYENTLVLYTRATFEATSTVVDNVRYCLKLIEEALPLNDDTNIGIGLTPRENAIFEIKHRIGTLEEVRNMQDFSELYNLVKY